MKKLFLLSISALFIIGCGSSDTKHYVISDDNNGTKSPRIKTVLYSTADNNKSEETITRYTYDADNLLISMKKSYVKAPTGSDGDKDISEVSHTYNLQKQIDTRKYYVPPFNHDGSNITYQYGDILHAESKLPIVSTESTISRRSSCTKEYTYNLNENNYATTIKSIETTCRWLFAGGGFDKKENYIYTYDAKGLLQSIVTTIMGSNLTKKKTFSYTDSKQIKEIIFNNSAKKIYMYNNQDLLQTVELYSSTDKLDLIKTYTYENKPHYHKQVPTSLDFDFFGSWDF